MAQASEKDFQAEKQEYLEKEFERETEQSYLQGKMRAKSLTDVYQNGSFSLRVGPLGMVIIGSLIFAELLFMALLVMSYFPETKGIVNKLLQF